MDYPPEKLAVWLLDDGGTVQKRNSDKVADAIAAEERHAGAAAALRRALA